MRDATVMGFSPEVLGGLIGLLVGMASFVALRTVAGQLERKAERERDPSGRRAAGIIRWVALFELFLFPAIGVFVGPMVMS